MMPENRSLVPEIRKIISQVLKVPLERVGEHASPENLPEWDSMNHIAIVVEIEERLGVSFEYGKEADLTSIDKIAKALGEIGMR